MMLNPSRRLLLGAAAGALAMPRLARAQAKEIIVAEPGHLVGYLPLYLAGHKGYFTEEGLSLRILTVESGAGHTNAVLTKQAFAFIGGPEHNAFAKAKGAELRAVCNVVDRGNVYFVARKGTSPKDRDFAAFVKGKTLATGLFGGTPNSITRYLLRTWNLDARRDVTMSELATAPIFAAMRARAADIGVITEPILTQGVAQNVWDEPFFNVPKELGPYAYSTLNIRLESMEQDPKMVEGFVRAVARGLKAAYADPDEAAAFARKEWPTAPVADIKATLDRTFADGLWSRDGFVSPEAWATGHRVVRTADILKTDVPYDAIIDMQFQRRIAPTI
ncbi:ABC transporter substrate-binding protein [Roseomonas sp. OT10]|uniref:ABC transporter substrate-binding protein n=1 Tax=Roseomonas cutis TaxID=2897332 RepID=UPI001E32A9DA|nr:ABC transporter substrate-binding protein [Roseomonas sp. OT10]UFN46935.1 ABC transporter substrate-binding protein [Roseomonas sp. OT10]